MPYYPPSTEAAENVPANLLTGWNPSQLGPNLIAWWDGRDLAHQTIVGGQVSSWVDKIGGVAATQAAPSGRPAAPTADGEVRFTGSGPTYLQILTMTRSYLEHRWFLILFRVVWSTAAAASGDLFDINGFQGTDGMKQPELLYQRAAAGVQMCWRNANGNTLSPVVAAAGDNVWHCAIGRRDDDGVTYLSVDGGAELSTGIGGVALPIPTSGQDGRIGDITAGKFLDWGLDTLIIGQGDLSDEDRANLYAWALRRRGIAAAAAFATAVETPDSYAAVSPADLSTEAWDTSTQGAALDLSGFVETFADDFTDIAATVTDGVVGSGPWFAPARADTSDAKFHSPTQSPNPFSQYDATTLQIEMSEVSTVWYSGHLQTVNIAGRGGFTQAVPPGGAVYYEAKIAVLAAVGWPAFWLYSVKGAYLDTAATKAEIDVLEAYGDNVTSQDQLHLTCFRHAAYRPQPGNDPAGSRSPTQIVTMSAAPFNVANLFAGAGAFNAYGCMIDEKWITYYFNGLVVARFPAYAEALQPLYLLLSYQMQDGFEGTATNPSYMWVDYVKAYSKS